MKRYSDESGEGWEFTLWGDPEKQPVKTITINLETLVFIGAVIAGAVGAYLF